jgi:hypothetical protein
MRPLFAGGHAIGLASIYLNRRLDRDLNAGTREHVVDFPMAAVQDTDSANTTLPPCGCRDERGRSLAPAVPCIVAIFMSQK